MRCKAQLRRPTPRPQRAMRNAGAQVFATSCASCHGADGKGTATSGSIVDGSFLALVSDQNLRTTVIAGRPDSRPSRLAQLRDRPRLNRLGSDGRGGVARLAAPPDPGSALSHFANQTMNSKRGEHLCLNPALTTNPKTENPRRPPSGKFHAVRCSESWVLAQCHCRRALRDPDHRLHPRSREPPADGEGSQVGFARRTDEISRGPNAVRDLSQSHLVPWDGDTGDVPCWVRRIQH